MEILADIIESKNSKWPWLFCVYETFGSIASEQVGGGISKWWNRKGREFSVSFDKWFRLQVNIISIHSGIFICVKRNLFVSVCFNGECVIKGNKRNIDRISFAVGGKMTKTNPNKWYLSIKSSKVWRKTNDFCSVCFSLVLLMFLLLLWLYSLLCSNIIRYSHSNKII